MDVKTNRIITKKYTANILEYTEGLLDRKFEQNSLIYDACVLNFINIGEQIPEVLKSPYFE